MSPEYNARRPGSVTNCLSAPYEGCSMIIEATPCTQPQGLATLSQEPAADRGEGLLMGKRPYYTAGHRCGEDEKDAGGLGECCASGEPAAAGCLQGANRKGVGDVDRGHDTIGKAFPWTYGAAGLRSAPRFTLGSQLLRTAGTTIEMALQVHGDEAGEAVVDLVEREMRVRGTAHSWPLLRQGKRRFHSFRWAETARSSLRARWMYSLHRAEREVEHLGDLLVGPAFDVAEENARAVFRPEPPTISIAPPSSGFHGLRAESPAARRSAGPWPASLPASRRGRAVDERVSSSRRRR